MENRRSTVKKSLLCTGTLLLSLAALQSALSRPHRAPHCVTVGAGESTVVEYDRNIEKAGILEKRMATPDLTGPRRLVVHGLEPGRTDLIICSKDGESDIYDLVVLPPSTVKSAFVY